MSKIITSCVTVLLWLILPVSSQAYNPTVSSILTGPASIEYGSRPNLYAVNPDAVCAVSEALGQAICIWPYSVTTYTFHAGQDPTTWHMTGSVSATHCAILNTATNHYAYTQHGHTYSGTYHDDGTELTYSGPVTSIVIAAAQQAIHYARHSHPQPLISTVCR